MVDNQNILNINKARKCCLRENDLCGGTASCKLCPYMRRVKELWRNFCNTPADSENYITQEWNNFPVGTERVVIMSWFIKTYDVDIKVLKQYAKW